MTRCLAPTKRARPRLALVALLLSLTLSCGGGHRKNSRIETMPDSSPVFREMWTLATLSDDLDAVMRSAVVNKTRAREILARMEGSVVRLEHSRERFRHPVLRNNLGRFYGEVHKARLQADAEPPNFYYAGKVSGACVYCHNPRGGIWRTEPKKR